ncbi:MAG: signal recognition particle receptor subunit beta [Planctomycetota bacterium]|jgi:signal recognition particle receptor subunit beta
MVQINFAKKQVNAKIVYYGPGMSGKTTNLEVIHQRAPAGNRGDLTSISTEGDRTLFFDFMPLDLGTVAGMRTCFQIYTVPGQVYYNSTRKLVLQGVDGVIFVADSSPNMMDENLESLANLVENLAEYGRSMEDMPMVIQYNKRDIPGALSIEELEEKLNLHGAPAFEGIANTGQGVFPTLKAVAATVLDSLHKQQGEASSAEPLRSDSAQASAASAPAAAAAPAPAPAAPGSISRAAPAPVVPVVAPAPATSGFDAPPPLPKAPGKAAAPAEFEVAAPMALAGPSVPAPEPKRQSISMSQTGFHKAPSVPLPGASGSDVSGLPAQPAVSAPERQAAPQPVAQSPAPGLTMAMRPQPLAQAPAPQAPAPQPMRQQQAPVQHAVQTAAPAPVSTPTSMMGVDAGTKVPKRRAPTSRSFSSSAPRPAPKRKQSTVVTGMIVVASVVIGAVLGSFVLSIL